MAFINLYIFIFNNINSINQILPNTKYAFITVKIKQKCSELYIFLDVVSIKKHNNFNLNHV